MLAACSSSHPFPNVHFDEHTGLASPTLSDSLSFSIPDRFDPLASEASVLGKITDDITAGGTVGHPFASSEHMNSPPPSSSDRAFDVPQTTIPFDVALHSRSLQKSHLRANRNTMSSPVSPAFARDVKTQPNAAFLPRVAAHPSALSYAQRTSNPLKTHRDQGPRVMSPYNSPATDRFTFSKPLPTPTQTPTSDSFLAPPPTFYTGQGNNYDGPSATKQALRQVMIDQLPNNGDNSPAFSHSSHHSLSSRGGPNSSPVTPRSVTLDHDYDPTRQPSTQEHIKHAITNLDQNMSDVYQDEFYNPASEISPLPMPPAKRPRISPSTFSPHLTVEQLQIEANNARNLVSSPSHSQYQFSMADATLRNQSALRPDSIYGTVAAELRENQRRAARGCKPDYASAEEMEPKTISPKDAMLDYHEDEEAAKSTLFPDDLADNYNQKWPTRWSTAPGPDLISEQEAYDVATEHSFGSMATSRPSSSSNFSPNLPQSTFNFLPASVPGQVSGYGGTSHPRSFPSAATAKQETDPEFPATLVSMESSVGEGECEMNDSNEGGNSEEAEIYTCTYHGCTQRFESQARLQKHKREGHRSVHHPASHSGLPPEPTGSEEEANLSATMGARNSQAGPHRCERLNPSTGKPCNQVFSRPYDLTRHEDTIHNARKQKVRCALCVEDKTFSRNDALTRHMRVVHPEVDFPGKHRRRGGGIP